MPGIAAEAPRSAASGLLSHDPLGALTSPPIGRNRRVSSNEQPNWHDGNMDMTWLQPGESVEVPAVKGPGMITHMWFTSHAGWANELNALSLRIYWDGRKEPERRGALGDFFAVGPRQAGRRREPSGAGFAHRRRSRATGGCRSPSRRGSSFPTTTPTAAPGCTGRWTGPEVDSLPADIGKLMRGTARNTQQSPRDYLIADLTGRGKYVGTVLSVTHRPGRLVRRGGRLLLHRR